MRLRNVKGASSKIDASKYIIKDYEKYRGNYKNIFNNDNKICIEIGMGKGDFIKGMSMMYPNVNFIGIEKYDSVMVRAIEKLEDTDIQNLRLIKMDAEGIGNVFAKEIDTIYLNFSDPWPKDRHEKRRLTSSNFLSKYDNLFSGTKHIIFKTDNRKLFEYSIKSLTNYGYRINNISLDLHKDVLINVETEYEKKFSALGYPIYMVDVTKD